MLQFGICRFVPFMYQQFIDEVDIGLGQLTALVLDLGGSWAGSWQLGSSGHQLSSTQVSPPALHRPDCPEQPAVRYGGSSLVLSQVLGSSLPTLTPPWPALLFCPGEVQSPLSLCVYGGNMGRGCQLSCSHASGLAHLHPSNRLSSSVPQLVRGRASPPTPMTRVNYILM